MKSTRVQCSGARSSESIDDLQRNRLCDHDIFFGNIIVESLATSFYAFDGVNDVGARNHFAENSVSPALLARCGVIQKPIVGNIDKELCSRGMRVPRAGHGDRVHRVFETVIGFILNGRIGGLLGHAGFHAAALDHESRNDTVKDGVVVMAFADIGQKIGDGRGCFVLVKFNRDDTVVCDVEFDVRVAHG